MNEDRLDRIIREEAMGHNAPPPTPREAIWAALETRRRGRRSPGFDFRRSLMPLLGAAAILLIGVALGRWSTRRANIPAPETARREVAAPRSGISYEVAAAGYLGRTETLLTEFRAVSGGGEDLTPRARELLGELRLFLDSPAARDPELRRLLLDLEVVLARIVHVADSSRERRDIRESLDERAIMMRIRNRIPTGL